VTDELGKHEKLDIIQWQPEIKDFLANALAPAKIESIDIDQDAKTANVTVHTSQAPLAIGKGGVNVNLAAELVHLVVNIIQIPDEVAAEVTAPEEAQKAPSTEETPDTASATTEVENSEEKTK
jgi:N utilization substance protein A